MGSAPIYSHYTAFQWFYLILWTIRSPGFPKVVVDFGDTGASAELSDGGRLSCVESLRSPTWRITGWLDVGATLYLPLVSHV
jgi:hypothetical protein